MTLCLGKGGLIYEYAKEYRPHLTEETEVIVDKTLFRIRALRSFGDIKAGDLGGFIENERNLSHTGSAWVRGEARTGIRS